MIKIAGYHIDEKIYQQKEVVAFKASRISDDIKVILKTTISPFPGLREHSRLNREYLIGKHLAVPGVPIYHEFFREGNRPVLAIEDYGAGTLKAFLQTHKVDILVFLKVAIQLADILNQVHRKGVIHLDVKSENILIHPSTLEIKLIDFGISSRLNQEDPKLVNPNLLQGTLSYMSPEQTGRMNRPVDFRSDFYSLGITLFEFITGRLPFEATDPMGMVHNHIAKLPPNPQSFRKDIPEVITHILQKLLQKSSEHRYQTAMGLKFDLEKCLSLLRQTGAISKFELAEKDLTDRFRIPQTLYGREAESKLLVHGFQKAAAGGREVVMVSGYSGIGKSVLIHEVQKPIVESQGIFISGKSDQYNREMPFSGFIQAITDFTEQLLPEPDEAIAEWKTQIMAALGSNARVLTDAIPQLELIIGSQPEVPQLLPEETKARFGRVIQQFLGVLAQKSHPLTLFLDDLQWADPGTLFLLETLVCDPDQKFLYAIGAYRHNEVGENHPLALTLENIEKKTAFRSIELAPLEPEHIYFYISDIVQRSKNEVTELGDLVYLKTQGNPFFLSQFLQSLHTEGHLVFNADKHYWEWDLENIRELDFTDNVVELMLGKLRKLPDSTQDMIKFAAAIGNRFDLSILAGITQQDLDTAQQLLMPAVTHRLILPENDYFQILGDSGAESLVNEPGASVQLRFLHDRVHEAAYSLLTEAEREQTHLKIGRQLLGPGLEEGSSDRIFEVVSHLNQGARLITTPEEREQLARLNLGAGMKAIGSTAYHSARSLLSIGVELLPENSWETHYELKRDLSSSIASCQFLVGDIEAAEMEYNDVLANCKTRQEKLRVYQAKLMLYMNIGNHNKAMESGLEALALFEITFPTTPEEIQGATGGEIGQVMGKMEGKEWDYLLEMSEIEDTETYELLSFMALLANSAYVSNPLLMGLIVSKSMNICLDNGNGNPSTGIYFLYGLLALMGMDDHETAYKLAKINLALFNTPGIRSGPSASLEFQFEAFVAYWKEDARSIPPRLQKAYINALDNGSILWGGYSMTSRIWYLSTLGAPLPQIEMEAQRHLSWLKRRQNDESVTNVEPKHRFAMAMQGKTPKPYSLDGDGYVYEDTVNGLIAKGSLTTIGALVIPRLQLLYHFGKHEESLEVIATGHQYIHFMAGFYYIIDFYFYESLTYIALFEQADAEQKDAWTAAIEGHLANFEKWMGRIEVNYRSFFLILSAEWARVNGKTSEVESLHSKAIKAANEDGFIQLEALANELAGEFFMDSEKEKIGWTFLTDARLGYERWGASAKVKQLQKKYPGLIHSGAGRQVTLASGSATLETLTTITQDSFLDLNTVMKASTAISGELVLENLLRTMTTIVVENAGAERGYILLSQEGRMFISSEYSVDEEKGRLMDNQPMEGSGLIPESVINYVDRTQQYLVLKDANSDVRFEKDPYIQNSKTKSVLCMPIINKGKVTGALYCENNLIPGAFTPNRVDMLKLLTGQIAISLENARLVENLENMVHNLEEIVNERTREIRKQRDEIESAKMKSDELLLNILPYETADELKKTKKVQPRYYESVTVLFSDFKGFTQVAEALTPEELVYELDTIFQAFDEIVEKHKVEKIKTIGDAYMCAGGLPVGNSTHPTDVINAALEIQDYMSKLRAEKKAKGELFFEARLGLHTGPIIAGVVGIKKFAYDIWGDTVNLAARMESSGVVGKVNISETTYELVKDQFNCIYRGKIEAKNKGEIDMYFVESKK